MGKYIDIKRVGDDVEFAFALPEADDIKEDASRLAHEAKSQIDDLREDVAAIRERDPAASSDLEVLLLYSGLHATASHRLAHTLNEKGLPLTARAISQVTKALTGIEIHPGAKIGKRVFIDHGSGVVIGETAQVGDDCTIYQGVTLGGTGKHTGKRHPTLGDGVMVGAGAKVLGPVNIGAGAKIAAGAVVLNDIPEDSTAVGIPAKVVRREGKRVEDLDQVNIPDPVSQELCMIRRQLFELEKKIETEEQREE